jgi:DNA-binding beta-propeller fold protein YncE
VILAAGLFTKVTAGASEHPRVLFYLEIHQTAHPNHLTLESMTLRGDGQEVSLPFAARELDAGEMAGRQILLASTTVPAGLYADLHLEISGIGSKIGVAEVRPESPPGGLDVALDLEIQPGRTETVLLHWVPAAVDPDTPFHSPDLSVRLATRPTLGSMAFVSSGEAGAVLVLDRKSARVVGALRVDDEPRGLAFSRQAQSLFVALGDQDAVAVVDVMSLRVINTANLQFGDDPTRLLLSPDGSSLFVLCPGSRTLASLATWSLQQQFRIAVGEGPRSMAQDPVSGLLYVACEDEGRVQVIDPATGTVSGTLSLAPAPAEIVIDDQSRQLFLGGSSQRAIRTFDLAAEEEVGDLSICGTASAIAANPRTRRIYVAIPGCRNLAVIRPDIGIEYSSVPLPGRPGLISFGPEFRRAWVVLPAKGQVAVCNVNRSEVEFVVDVGADPYQVLVP